MSFVDTCGIRTPPSPCKGEVLPLHYMAHKTGFFCRPPEVFRNLHIPLGILPDYRTSIYSRRQGEPEGSLRIRVEPKTIQTAFHVTLAGLEPARVSPYDPQSYACCQFRHKAICEIHPSISPQDNIWSESTISSQGNM